MKDNSDAEAEIKSKSFIHCPITNDEKVKYFPRQIVLIHDPKMLHM